MSSYTQQARGSLGSSSSQRTFLLPSAALGACRPQFQHDIGSNNETQIPDSLLQKLWLLVGLVPRFLLEVLPRWNVSSLPGKVGQLEVEAHSTTRRVNRTLFNASPAEHRLDNPPLPSMRHAAPRAGENSPSASTSVRVACLTSSPNPPWTSDIIPDNASRLCRVVGASCRRDA